MKKNYVTEIIETIKDFNWKVKQIWVDNNCIYAEVLKPNGKIEDEGLYAASEEDPEDVYRVFAKLRYTMNFTGMLNNDNIMI